MADVAHRRIQNLLETIYNRTAKDERFKLYNMLNLAMVIHGIRPGCLVMGISEGMDILQELESIGCMGAYILTSRSGSIHLCVVRADDAERVTLLQSIVEKDIIISRNENVTTLQFNITDTFSTDERDKEIGFLLGYINPIALRNTLRYNKSVCIEVDVEKNGQQFTLRMFPQKVGSLSASQKEMLISMADAIRRLELPLGVTIRSAEVIVETNGVRNVIRHVQNGGTRRVVRRRRRRHSGRRVRLTKKN